MLLTNRWGNIHTETTGHRGHSVMLDHILQCVQAFEREHNTSPDVVYINPFHYEGLYRYHPGLFEGHKPFLPGVRLVIVPANLLTHPEAAFLSDARCWPQVA